MSRSRTKLFSIKTGVVFATATAVCAVLTAGGCGGGDDIGGGGDGITYGTLNDSRDGKSYRTVTIGAQTWMAQNLNYAGPNGSTGVCYENSPDSCAKYGRLYDWNTVMGGASSSSLNPSGVQGVCPAGWHVPSDAEWEALVKYVDPNASGNGSNVAGTKLKSKSGWNTGTGYKAGTDDYGFSALPGGYGYGGDFIDVGNYGYWWSATEHDAGSAWHRDMYYNYEYVDRYHHNKTNRFVLRCCQD